MAEHHLIWGEARPMPRSAQVIDELRERKDAAKASAQRLAAAWVTVHDQISTRSIAGIVVGWLVAQGVAVTVSFAAVGPHLEISLHMEAA